MKQNTPAVYLQISTAQGPAECRIFARFVLGKLLAQAQAKGIDAELVTETADKHGILSATLKLEGQKAESLAQTWQGTLQWICPSPVRPKHPRKNWYIGVFRLPDMPQMYEMPSETESSFKPVVRVARVGNTSIKPRVLSALPIKKVAFPCGSRANAASTPIRNWR